MSVQRSFGWMILLTTQVIWLAIVMNQTQRSKLELWQATEPLIIDQRCNSTACSSNELNGESRTGSRFEIVVTILHDRQQSKRSASNETTDWLLSPEIQDIPVTICSPDQLRQGNKTKKTAVFRPEDAFSDLLNSNRSGKVTILPMVNGFKAGEAPGYLTYILQNWDSLPDVTIFLHGNPMAHNPNILSDIKRVAAGEDQTSWTPQQIGFLQLNLGPMLCRVAKGPTGKRDDWPVQWTLLGFDLKRFPGRVKMPCCAQFMVTKERILLRPKWFYQQALKIVYEFSDATFFEHFWHILWGEQAILSEDRELRTYVLSNWTKPVHDAVLHKPYINHSPLILSESIKPWYETYLADPDSYYPIVRKHRDSCPPGDYCYLYFCGAG